jgi:exopolysaccharide biosynthesis polyprenyl glycosylphosphotransferase
MLKEHHYIFSRVNMAIDFALTGLSVWIAHLLRNHIVGPYLLPDLFPQPAQFSDYSWLAYTLPFIMVAALRHNGYYQSRRVRPFGDAVRVVALSAVETAVAAMVITFFLARDRLADLFSGTVAADTVSRGVIAMVPFIISILVIAKTWAVRRVLMRLRRSGRNWRSVILVGSGEKLREFVRLVGSHPFWGFKLEGVVDDSGREAKLVEGIPVLGECADLIPLLERNPVDEVVFIPGRRSLEELAPLFEQCEEMGVRTRLALSFFHSTIARPVLDSFQDIAVVTFSPVREMSSALLFKYAFDRIAALALLILLSPLLLATVLAIKISSRSWRAPVLYGQTRCGLHGRPFTLHKFRSMRVGADKELAALRERNEMAGPVFKIRDDPRVTPLGRLLRKTSIDELPQIWNVLVGEMSLVGPRPPLPSEVEQYDRWQRRRLSMKPGITCLWQVKGRNQIPFETWMKLDLEYIDNWSLLLDFKILCRTVYVVATGYGAM